jgi:hypothetical protein
MVVLTILTPQEGMAHPRTHDGMMQTAEPPANGVAPPGGGHDHPIIVSTRKTNEEVTSRVISHGAWLPEFR